MVQPSTSKPSTSRGPENPENHQSGGLLYLISLHNKDKVRLVKIVEGSRGKYGAGSAEVAPLDYLLYAACFIVIIICFFPFFGRLCFDFLEMSCGSVLIWST